MSYLVLDSNDKQSKADYIKWMTQEYDILYNNSPNIPQHIIEKLNDSQEEIHNTLDKLKTESLVLNEIVRDDNSSGSKISLKNVNDTDIVINMDHSRPKDFDKAIEYHAQRFMVTSYNK